MTKNEVLSAIPHRELATLPAPCPMPHAPCYFSCSHASHVSLVLTLFCFCRGINLVEEVVSIVLQPNIRPEHLYCNRKQEYSKYFAHRICRSLWQFPFEKWCALQHKEDDDEIECNPGNDSSRIK